jgi:integrase/recombinase XerC
LFKVIYGWGLRRTETARLDLADWVCNPAAAEFGRYGMLHVRYGKAVRGQPPRRRNVASVMGWAVEAVADYVENIRPRFGAIDHPALWVTERGADHACGDQCPVHRLPGCARPATRAVAPFHASCLCHPPDRGRRRPPVHPGAGGHRCDTSTAIYTNPRELHQKGAFALVA